MFNKLAVLKLDLGHRHNDITLRDIQLWNKSNLEQQHVDKKSQAKVITMNAKFLTYVDISCLPIWLINDSNSSHDSELYCFTTSNTSLSFFKSKLKYNNRGIVIEISKDKNNRNLSSRDNTNPLIFSDHIVFYQANNFIQYFYLNIDRKTEIEYKINKLEKLKSDTELVINTVTKLDEYSKLNEDPRNKIDKILKKSYEQNRMNTNKVMRSLQISDKRLQFNDTLSKVILGGLRLRGIPNTQIGFQKLYKITFEASEFALRDELTQLLHNKIQEISFEKLQETVEVLLNLFLKS
ncbi:hypothetical protein TPHA_0H01290 [Tetrapisispora phaffii CBS 4417]|uniref:Mitochondrial morphogenesis protein SLD7 n=1 Tax=Tetrapisispora phaffii (strain ATCC 24235 / CBS 4417 / NBRC 1672 / NRRL Y-8282 / UCD 70-5) TaxID=1071381 RepID=G8BX32_TETPH|nr:hypothetical protein TPHA_0H01290 [Tetrapisispora phaffii CBS 4417]CCE64336.1 hypothetical protein TPHA_0H01290 [Tetrapisispora phaffii CBS 4417]